MEKTMLSTPDAPAAIGPYAQGWAVGPWVYTSGQIGADPRSGELPAGITAQAEQRRHAPGRGEDHLLPGGHGGFRRLQRGLRPTLSRLSRPQLRGGPGAAQGRSLRDRGRGGPGMKKRSALTAQSVFAFFRTSRMPRVPGPQWEKIVQPAFVSRISPKRPSCTRMSRAIAARWSSGQVSTRITRLVSRSVRPSSRSRR